MAETKHWAAEATSYRPSEYAPDFMALVYDPTPGGRKNDDGSTSFSMRFPALILTEYVSDPATVAADLASKLNAHASQASRIAELEKALSALLVQALQSELNTPAHEWGHEAIQSAIAALPNFGKPVLSTQAAE